MDVAKIFSVILQAGYFIAAFAAIAAGILMSSVTKKFGTGILASGFRDIAAGVFLLAGGIIVDSLNAYLQLADTPVLTFFLILKEVFFVLGTYTIVIGTKKTVDKLESLTK